jgi:hypothetical protein
LSSRAAMYAGDGFSNTICAACSHTHTRVTSHSRADRCDAQRRMAGIGYVLLQRYTMLSPRPPLGGMYDTWITGSGSDVNSFCCYA